MENNRSEQTANWRAAQFVLNIEAKDIRKETYEDMARGALLDIEKGTVKQIAEEIAKPPPHFQPIDFLLQDALERLVARKRVIKSDGTYSLPSTERRQLEMLVEQRKQDFLSVERAWFDEMIERGHVPQDISPDNLETMRHDLRVVCLKMWEIHAADYAKFLANEKDSLEVFLDRTSLRENLPTQRPPYLLRIEGEVFPRFFISPDGARRRYIGRLAQTYARLSILNAESRGREILNQKLEGVRVYLDTNMLFALFGLNQQDRKEVMLATERLLEVNRTLGVEQYVSLATIEEFLRCRDGAEYTNLGPMVPADISQFDEDEV